MVEETIKLGNKLVGEVWWSPSYSNTNPISLSHNMANFGPVNGGKCR